MLADAYLERGEEQAGPQGEKAKGKSSLRPEGYRKHNKIQLFPLKFLMGRKWYRITAKSHKINVWLMFVIRKKNPLSVDARAAGKFTAHCLECVPGCRVTDPSSHGPEKRERLPCLAGFRSPSTSGLGSGLALE